MYLQTAAVHTVPVIVDYFNDDQVKTHILPKVRRAFSPNDHSSVCAVLDFVSKVVVRLDRLTIIDEVLPIILDVKLINDVDVLIRVVGTYIKILKN